MSFSEFINYRRSGGGFTLLEIMIVVAMLGIIIAIAIPRFIAKDRSDMNPLQQMNKTVTTQDQEGFMLEPGVYEIWLKDCNKFIKIKVSDVGG